MSVEGQCLPCSLFLRVLMEIPNFHLLGKFFPG